MNWDKSTLIEELGKILLDDDATEAQKIHARSLLSTFDPKPPVMTAADESGPPEGSGNGPQG